jgi:hypothetical protein
MTWVVVAFVFSFLLSLNLRRLSCMCPLFEAVGFSSILVKSVHNWSVNLKQLVCLAWNVNDYGQNWVVVSIAQSENLC